PDRRRAGRVLGRAGELGPRAHPERAPAGGAARALLALPARGRTRLARAAGAGRGAVAEVPAAAGRSRAMRTVAYERTRAAPPSGRAPLLQLLPDLCEQPWWTEADEAEL